MIRKVTQNHIDTAKKVMAKHRFAVMEMNRGDYTKFKKCQEEWDYLEKVFAALCAENDALAKQPSLL